MTVSERNRKIKEAIEINKKVSGKHKYNDELALLRKEIHHIEEVLNIAPTEEFAEYHAEAENVKAEIKAKKF